MKAANKLVNKITLILGFKFQASNNANAKSDVNDQSGVNQTLRIAFHFYIIKANSA